MLTWFYGGRNVFAGILVTLGWSLTADRAWGLTRGLTPVSLNQLKKNWLPWLREKGQSQNDGLTFCMLTITINDIIAGICKSSRPGERHPVVTRLHVPSFQIVIAWQAALFSQAFLHADSFAPPQPVLAAQAVNSRIKHNTKVQVLNRIVFEPWWKLWRSAKCTTHTTHAEQLILTAEQNIKNFKEAESICVSICVNTRHQHG